MRKEIIRAILGRCILFWIRQKLCNFLFDSVNYFKMHTCTLSNTHDFFSESKEKLLRNFFYFKYKFIVIEKQKFIHIYISINSINIL